MFLCGDFLVHPNSAMEFARADVQFTPACQPHCREITTVKLVARKVSRIGRCGLFMCSYSVFFILTILCFFAISLSRRRRRFEHPSAFSTAHAGVSGMLLAD